MKNETPNFKIDTFEEKVAQPKNSSVTDQLVSSSARKTE